MSRHLAIGELSASTNTSISAIRYYERRGLVEPSGRVGNKRRFDPRTVQRIGFINNAKTAGFSLDQIAKLLEDHSGDWVETVAQRLTELEQQRRELDRTAAALEAVLGCGCRAAATCPRSNEL